MLIGFEVAVSIKLSNLHIADLIDVINVAEYLMQQDLGKSSPKRYSYRK